MPNERRTLLRSLGERIKELRIRTGLTQAELGDRAGLSAKYVSELERGLRNPSLATLQRIAGGMGTSLAVLVCGIDAARRGGAVRSAAQGRAGSHLSSTAVAAEEPAQYHVELESILAGQAQTDQAKLLDVFRRIAGLVSGAVGAAPPRQRVRRRRSPPES
jgi:transcriptional regulator with XRE-family HTH domain